MGPNNLVIGWKDDTHVLFRSRRTEWNDFLGKLYLASTGGGPIEELPLPRGGFASYSADGQQLVYNRVFREFRTWKRYRGGMADDVWLYDFRTKATTNLTNNPALDIIPMWKGNTVYFVSDRDAVVPDEPLQLQPRLEADEEADRLHRVRHQVPLARRQRHRLRERRVHLPVRPRLGEVREGAGDDCRGLRREPRRWWWTSATT